MGDNILDIDIDFEDLNFEDTPRPKPSKKVSAQVEPRSGAKFKAQSPGRVSRPKSEPAQSSSKRLKLNSAKFNQDVMPGPAKISTKRGPSSTKLKPKSEISPAAAKSFNKPDVSRPNQVKLSNKSKSSERPASSIDRRTRKLSLALNPEQNSAEPKPKTFHKKPKAGRKIKLLKLKLSADANNPGPEAVSIVKLASRQAEGASEMPQLKAKPAESAENKMASGGYSFGQLNHLCNLVRQDVLDMLYHAGSGHSAGSLDQVEIFVALYFKAMRYDASDPTWGERDILVQSNGHTVPVRYAVMARAGFFPRHDLLSLRQFNSKLQGHPERERMPSLETTSGPLGSGLSQAAGMALSLMMDENRTRRIYFTMGDGELDEGNIWEAAMFAAKYKLGNLIGIIDRNNIQIDGFAEDVMPLEDLRAKWEAFGWYVQEIDGNNIESVVTALSLAKTQTAKPNLIIAHTIPGKGVDFMEYDPAWHGKAPNQQQEKDAIRRLRTLDGKIEGGHL